MADPYVRAIDRVTGLDEIPVDVGVDYDSVTITIGIHTVRLEHAEADQFARAYNDACWQAGANAERMRQEAGDG